MKTPKERSKEVAMAKRKKKDWCPLDDLDDFEWEEEPKVRKVSYKEIKEKFPPEIADKFKPKKKRKT